MRRNCRLQGTTILLLQQDLHPQQPEYLRFFGASGLIYPCAIPAALHCPARRVISDARATMEIIARNIQSAMTAVLRMECLHVRFTAGCAVMVTIARNIPALIAVRMDILHVRITVRCVVMVIIAWSIPAMNAVRMEYLHARFTAICANMVDIARTITTAAAREAAPEATNVLSEPAHCC